MLNKHKKSKNIDNNKKTARSRNVIKSVNNSSKVQLFNKNKKANIKTNKPHTVSGFSQMRTKTGKVLGNKYKQFNKTSQRKINVFKPKKRTFNSTLNKKVVLNRLRHQRVIHGTARMFRTRYAKNKDVQTMLLNNIGLKSDRKPEIRNKLSIFNSCVFNNISEMVFNWSNKIGPYRKDWSRIEDQYKKALSTLTPDECSGKFKESKLLFNIINKVYHKIDIPTYSTTISSRQVDIDIVFERIVLDILEDKDVLDSMYRDGIFKKDEPIDIVGFMDKIRNQYGAREFISFIVNNGINDIMKKADFHNFFTDIEDGMIINTIKAGVSIATIEDYDNDIGFKIVPLSPLDVVFDTNINSIRGGISTSCATRFLRVYRFNTLEEAKKAFPNQSQYLDNCIWGRLPFSQDCNHYDNWYNVDNTRMAGEIALYEDLINGISVLIAGSDASIIKYEDKMNKSFEDMNLFIFKCFQGDWVYGKGIGHFASQLNNIDSLESNVLMKAFIEDNSNIDVLHVREGSRNIVKNEIKKAQQDSLLGERGIAISEYNNTEGQEIRGLTPLSSSTQWGADKVPYLDKVKRDDIIGAGVNMEDVNSNPYKTRDAVNADNIIAQEIGIRIEEVNSLEFKNLIKGVIDRIKKVKNSISINTEKLDTKMVELRNIMQPKVKHLKDIVKSLDIEVETEFTSSVQIKDSHKIKSLQSVLPSINPNSLAYAKLGQKLSSLAGVELSESDFLPIPQEPQQVQQQPIQGVAQ